jgi:hypothetical protein
MVASQCDFDDAVIGETIHDHVPLLLAVSPVRSYGCDNLHERCGRFSVRR